MGNIKTEVTKVKNHISTTTVLVRDLREGIYKDLPAKKFSGNIFLTDNEFYQVMNGGNWKRIKSLEERKALFLEIGTNFIDKET